MKTGVPIIGNHSYSKCERIAKLSKETLGQQRGEKLNYDMLTLIFNIKFILILKGVFWAPTV